MDQGYNTSLKISQWAEEDRPREKLMLKGKSTLTDAELIGILLRSGTVSLTAVEVAKQILRQVNNDLNELAKLSVHDLQKIKGVGEAKAISIISALELGRRRKETISAKKDIITSSKIVHDIMYQYLVDLNHEQFWVIMLNRANMVLKKVMVSQGGVSGTVADPKLIFKSALENLASAIILVHNHPSGNLKPSEADITLTRKVKSAGTLLEIPVLDHIIFTNNGYYSFADEGTI